MQRRLKEINLNKKWDEESEDKSCPTCPQFPDQTFQNQKSAATDFIVSKKVLEGSWLVPCGWTQAGTQLTTEGTGEMSSCGTRVFTPIFSASPEDICLLAKVRFPALSSLAATTSATE